jgi:acid phosphatase
VRPNPDDGIEIGDPNLRPDQADVLTFYALGDWDTGEEGQKAVADALAKNVTEIPPGRIVAPFVLGLGDNVYERGLHAGWNNSITNGLLEKTFGEIYNGSNYDGEPLLFHIIPGNHDHNGQAGGKHGWGDVIHQETTAEKLYSAWQYYPIDSAKNSDTDDSTNYEFLKREDIFTLALPEKITLGAKQLISVIALDTQVMLELYQRDDQKLLQLHWDKLASLLNEEAVWKIIIGHHPIRSHGRHGGFRSAVWWLPPIFLFTIIDQLFIKRLQDLDNPANRRFQQDLASIMNQSNVRFYISGHEHNLQVLKIDDKRLQIVSGSAGKLSSVTHKSDTIFSHAAYGLMRFDVTEDELWLECFEVDPKNKHYNSTTLLKIKK